MSEAYSVLLTQDPLPPLLSYAEVLARLWKKPSQDAIHDLKARWGIVGQNLEKEKAMNMVDALKDNHISSMAILSSRLPILGSSQWVERVKFASSGLDVSHDGVKWNTVAWNTIEIMSVAILKEKSVKTLKTMEGPSSTETWVKTGIMLTTGIPMRIRRKKEVQKKVEETELILFLDLFLSKPSLRLRFYPSRMDFKFLESDMQMGVLSNFKIFVERISACTPSARKNQGCRSLISPSPSPLLPYDTEEQFDAECLWYLALIQGR